MANETTTMAEPELLPEPEPANLARRDERPQGDRPPLTGKIERTEGGLVTKLSERVIVRASGDNIGDLYGAMAAAQMEEGYGDIERTRTARVQGKSRGGDAISYTYSYETLADVIAATRPQLAKHGLVVLQFPFTGTATITIRTRLAHASGQWIESDIVANIVSLAPQDVGSGVTFMRRYAQKAILNLAADDDDDDGEKASGVKRPAPPKAAPRKSAQAPQPSEPQAPADPHVGTVVEGPSENAGAHYVKLSTGFRCATRDPELVRALEAHKASGAVIELVCKAPSSPKFAPTLEEIVIQRGRA